MHVDSLRIYVSVHGHARARTVLTEPYCLSPEFAATTPIRLRCVALIRKSSRPKLHIDILGIGYAGFRGFCRVSCLTCCNVAITNYWHGSVGHCAESCQRA